MRILFDTLHLDPLTSFATAPFSEQTMPGYNMPIEPAQRNYRSFSQNFGGFNQNAIANRPSQQSLNRNNPQLSIGPAIHQPQQLPTRSPQINQTPQHSIQPANRPALPNSRPSPGIAQRLPSIHLA